MASHLHPENGCLVGPWCQATSEHPEGGREPAGSPEEALIREIRYLNSAHAVDPAGVHTRAILHNATQRLASDLYSVETHFIMELVQNADDNHYELSVGGSQDGGIPTLSISAQEGGILIENNERGFTPVDVRAICSIDMSSKRHCSGFIGEKGIGFKSVFKVADEVFISSKGFSFKFDARTECGMITPQWMQPEDLPFSRQEGCTQVYLRYKQHVQLQDLEQQLRDVHECLLMYLKKLRRLELSIGSEQLVFTMERLGTDQVRLVKTTSRQGSVYNLNQLGPCGPSETMTTTQHYYIHTSFVTVTTDCTLSVKRQSIDRTEVVLAFPTDPLGDFQVSEAPQYVYAYLPLRTYGFMFQIQGDFLVPSSREDVHHGEKWNHMLRDAVKTCFLEVFQDLKATPTRARDFLQFIPLPGEVQDGFFRPLADAIPNSMQQTCCLLSADGQWMQPSVVLQPPPQKSSFSYELDMATMPIVSNEQLFRGTGKRYLDESMIPNTPRLKAVLRLLHCEKFSMSDLVKCLTRSFDQDSLQPVSWYQGVYRCLLHQGTHLTADQWKKLWSAPLLMVKGKRAPSRRDQLSEVYFWRQNILGADLPGLEVLTFLDPRVVDEHTEPLLKVRFGVLEPSIHVLVTEVLRLYSHGTAHKMIAAGQHEDLLCHVRFIVHHLPSIRPDMLHLDVGKALLLRGEDGQYYPVDAVYYPQKGEGWDLRDLIPGPFLHNQYWAEGGPDGTDLAEALLKTFKLSTCPRITSRCFSPDFLQNLQVVEKYKSVLAMLHDNWTSYYAHHAQQGPYLSTELSRMMVRTRQGQAALLKNTYFPGSDIVRWFGAASLPYLDVEVQPAQDWSFLPSLGVQVQANVFMVLSRLSQVKESTEPVVLSSVHNMYEVLQVLVRNNDQDCCVVKARFESCQLVYVPPSSASGSQGMWVAPGDVQWSGYHNPRSSHVLLSETYPELRELFTCTLGVKDVGIRELVEDLKSMAREQGCIDEEAVQKVYLELNRCLRQTPEDDQVWFRDQAATQPLVLVKCGQAINLVSTRECDIYIADDAHLGQLMADVAYLLHIPASQLPRCQLLLKHLHPAPRPLSLSVKESFTFCGGSRQLSSEYTRFLAECFDYCARILYHHNVQEYDDLESSGELHRLASCTVYTCPEVSVRYTLGALAKEVITCAGVEHIKDGMAFYVNVSKSSKSDCVTQLSSMYCQRWTSERQILALMTTTTCLVASGGGTAMADQVLACMNVTGVPRLEQLPVRSAVGPLEVADLQEGTRPEDDLVRDCGNGVTSEVGQRGAGGCGVEELPQEGAGEQEPTGQALDRLLVTGRPADMKPNDGGGGGGQEGEPFEGGRSSDIGEGLSDIPAILMGLLSEEGDELSVKMDQVPLESSSHQLNQYEEVIQQAINNPEGFLAKIKRLPDGEEPIKRNESNRVLLSLKNFKSELNGETEAPPLCPVPDSLILGASQESPAFPDGVSSASSLLAQQRESEAVLLSGALGEKFIYELFSKELPGFGWRNWVSDIKYHFAPGAARDGAADKQYYPCDFVYYDQEGRLCGQPGTMCLLEVKATTGKGAAPFLISGNEWRAAQELEGAGGRNDPEGPQVYMIVRVERVTTRPRVFSILVDPSAMWRRGLLTVMGEKLVIEHCHKKKVEKDVAAC